MSDTFDLWKFPSQAAAERITAGSEKYLRRKAFSVYSKISQIFLGSVAEDVVKNAPCDVLVIR